MMRRIFWAVLILLAASPLRAAEPSPAFSARAGELVALLNGTADRPAAVVAQLATAVISLVFVILCVKSFVDARRNRAV